jgi:segregation and condensation protein B
MLQDFKLGELEAVLFAAGEPVAVPRLAEILDLTKPQVWDLVSQLTEALKADNRGLMVREVGGGFQLCTKIEFDESVNQLAASKELKISNAAMETLAIIAFKQPVTRGEMEAIRGVKVDGVVNTLLEYELIAEAGRKDTIGKPIMYATTPKFLETFGLKSLDDLPQLPEDALQTKGDTPEEISLLDFVDEDNPEANAEGAKPATEQAEVAETEQAPQNASAEQTEAPAPEQVATAPSAEAPQAAPAAPETAESAPAVPEAPETTEKQ